MGLPIYEKRNRDFTNKAYAAGGIGVGGGSSATADAPAFGGSSATADAPAFGAPKNKYHETDADGNMPTT